MSGKHNRATKSRRYEAKYLISERQAAEVRRYCRDRLPLDRHALPRPANQYPILSMYLDSRARELLHQSLFRSNHRYKLRVRTYRGYTEPGSGLPAFLEIKRKTNGVVHKTRARVSSDVASAALWRNGALLGEQGKHDGRTTAHANEFLQLRYRIAADPVVGVYYLREAYQGISAERLRITLDRNLHYGLLAAPGDGTQEVWWPVATGGVILEVKFTNTYPRWVSDMLHRVEVLRRGVCKYVMCCRAAGSSGLRAAMRPRGVG